MLSKVAASEGLTKVEESPSEFAHVGVSRRPPFLVNGPPYRAVFQYVS